MKTLAEIQIEYAKSIGFSNWFDLLRHQLNAQLIHRDYNEVTKRYALQACEDLRERIAENACLEPNGMLLQVDKQSILETEILLP